MVGRARRALPAMIVIAVGLAVFVGGFAVYSQRGALVSQVSMPAGFPSDPDATVGLIVMGLGAALAVSGTVLVFAGTGPSGPG